VDEHPKVYEAIEVTYRVRGKGMDPRAVEWFIRTERRRSRARGRTLSGVWSPPLVPPTGGYLLPRVQAQAGKW
jgi:hypothetical protein